ncbi:Cubilin [Orchesella cincta]|uniref:Cubilin n=1 Tax=Orchesella cincta TaxID=48709 RepID=A0A1D2NGT8_ORCCI|nr:Cubilin [Orchesella cincta]
MLFGILMWIVISLGPLQTSPEFVVHEIEACCHHRIALKCSGDEHMKIAVVQARYVIDSEEQIPATASSSHRHYPFSASRQNETIVLPPPSSSASNNPPLSRNPRTISLWDLDIKFVHDLINENLPHPVHVNAPPWHPSHISHFEDKKRFQYRRVTIPPVFNKDGLNFTATRVIEMPPYQLKFLDKDTIWREPLFSIGESESSIMSSDSYVPNKNSGSGGGVGKRSHHQEPPTPNEQVPSTETNTESGAYDDGVGECWSYQALSSTSATFTTDSSKIKPPWHFKDLRAYFNQRCSGRSKCTVELVRGNQPDPDVTKLCHLLPEGKVTVKYLCYNSTSEDVHSRCNVDVMPANEGFLHNPGYPDLYPGDEPCQWRLHVPQQKILLVFFDISLRGQYIAFLSPN